MFGVFKSARRVNNYLNINLRKTALKTLNLLKKNDFSIFEPQNCQVIENSSKAPLNFSPLECTYLGKNSFQYHSA